MHCDIVKDLLPLYAEGIASQESRKMVEAHLSDCPVCQKALEDLQKDLPEEQDTALPLKKISRGIRKRRLCMALMVASLVLALATAIFSFMAMPRYVPYQEGLFTVREIKVDELLAGEITQDTIDILAQAGILHAAAMAQVQKGDKRLVTEALQYDGAAGEDMPLPDTLLEITVQSGYYAGISSNPDAEAQAKGIQVFDLQLYGYRYDRPGVRGELKIIVAVEKGKRAALYYLEPDQMDRLVYGPDPIPEGGRITMPWLALNAYLMLAAALGAILIVLVLIFRRRARLRMRLMTLLGLPASWILAQLMIKGRSGISWQLQQDFWFILVTACFLYLAWLLHLSRVREKRLEE